MVTATHTLHLLAAAPRLWPSLLPEIQAVWQSGDLLLLLGEGAAGFNAAALAPFDAVALLDSDIVAMHISSAEIPAAMIRATHALWATWTLDYSRSITWR